MIEFSDARIPMGRDRRLHVAEWSLETGEIWVIAGPGGSGKTSLAKAIAGAPDRSGKVHRIPGLSRTFQWNQEGSWISFDREQGIRDSLRRDDDSEVLGRPDEGTRLEQFLDTPDARRYLSPDLLKKLAGRGIKNLSTGEFRQVLIARDAGRKPELAVLDEPFEGLDVSARPRLMKQLAEWASTDTLIVLTVNRFEDIPDFATGLALLDGEKLTAAGKPAEILGSAQYRGLFDKNNVNHRVRMIPPPPTPFDYSGRNLIEMRNLSLAYNGRTVLNEIDWTVETGESWLLTGPNGSGKTTLLNLISGDEPRGYGQDFKLFGKLKGSGESTYEIKSRLGQVSASIQESAPRHADIREIVGSGLKDSLVMTSVLDGFEIDLVKQWIDVLGLTGKEEIPFFRLSFGDRGLAMIGRAMIKHPPLLLLDEPMHGLDNDDRHKVAELVDILVKGTDTTVLFVSHRPDDAPSSIRNHIRLVPDESTGFSRAEVGLR